MTREEMLGYHNNHHHRHRLYCVGPQRIGPSQKIWKKWDLCSKSAICSTENSSKLFLAQALYSTPQTLSGIKGWGPSNEVREG